MFEGAFILTQSPSPLSLPPLPNQPFFCVGGNVTNASHTSYNASEFCTHAPTAMVVMTTPRPLNISVDEDALAVDVDAGVLVSTL